MPFAAVHESVVGTKRTSRARGGASAVEGQADVRWASSDVAFCGSVRGATRPNGPGRPCSWRFMMFLFVVEAAGRSPGFDAWLRRDVPAVRDGRGLVGWSFNVAASHHFL